MTFYQIYLSISSSGILSSIPQKDQLQFCSAMGGTERKKKYQNLKCKSTGMTNKD